MNDELTRTVGKLPFQKIKPEFAIEGRTLKGEVWAQSHGAC
jgi:hypothetical protein